MNIIEIAKNIIEEFPKIKDIYGSVHIDLVENSDGNYGLYSTGDTLIKEYVDGTQKRQHNFILYAMYQSINDYDRLSNNGVLLELQMWLENYTDSQKIFIDAGDLKMYGKLEKIKCSNGMLFNIPSDNYNDAVQYQIQINVRYTLEKGD